MFKQSKVCHGLKLELNHIEQYLSQVMLTLARRSNAIIRRRVNGFSTLNEFTPEQLSKSQKYVEETLRSRTWVTYMLASYLPSQLRIHYYTIQLFDMELTKISENARQPSLALGRLDFWKQSLHNIYQGEKPQPEPISICLHNAIRTNPLTQGYFSRMIKVRATEITNRSISSMADMRKMADDSKSTLLALNLELLRIEITDSHMQEAISYLGQAIGICEYLRRVPYSLRNNRFMLPEEILTKYNLTTKNIWDRVYGKPSQQLFDGVLEIASYAKKAFENAVRIYKEHPTSFPQHSFRALLQGVQTEYYLENLEKYNFNLFDQNLNNFSPVSLPVRVYNAAKAKQFSVGMQLKQ